MLFLGPVIIYRLGGGGGGREGARGVGGFLGGSLHFLREQKVVVGGGGSFVIRGSLKLLQGFRGETTQICSDNAQMLGKHRLRILDLVFNSTGLAF